MPTAASTVGPLELPLPAGAVETAIDDPTISGLAAYLAFWLNYDLNAKLATLATGRAYDTTSVTTAVPSGNVFCWDPTKPNAFFVRGQEDGAQHPLPALYVWDDSDKRKPFGTVHSMRERAVKAAWIFEEALLPGWNQDRYGLRAAACATMFRAIEQGWHPDYNPRQSIAYQLCLAGPGIVYQGSARVMLSPVIDSVTNSDQPAVRAYPAAVASYLVYEREEGQMAVPADQTPDLVARATIRGLPVGTHVVPAPPYPKTT